MADRFNAALGSISDLDGCGVTELKHRYRAESKLVHPDVTDGTVSSQVALNTAWAQIQRCVVDGRFSAAVARVLFDDPTPPLDTTPGSGTDSRRMGGREVEAEHVNHDPGPDTADPSHSPKNRFAGFHGPRVFQRYDKAPKGAFRTVDTIVFEVVVVAVVYAVSARPLLGAATAVTAAFGFVARKEARLVNIGALGALAYAAFQVSSGFSTAPRTVAVVTAAGIGSGAVYIPLYWWRSIYVNETRLWFRAQWEQHRKPDR